MRFKVNSCSITNEENYEQIVKEVMGAKNKTKKTSLDYRRLKRYDILTAGTITKLTVPLHRSNNNEVKRYLPKSQLGLAGSALPTSVVEKLFSEEDVEKITRDVAEAGSSEVEKPVEVQSFTGEKKFVENEDIAKTAKIQNTRERRKAVCRDEARFEHKQTVLHEKTNNIKEEYSVLQKVHLNIQKNQLLAISGLEEQAIRMKMHSDYKFPPIEKGTTVTIPVPDVDRSKGDLRNLIGIVMEVTPDSFYKIGTKTGALSNLYSRSQIAPCSARK
ncbi:hypothetical protein QE152_g11099 [Popillia japonica]|uniref:Uncharacterized protein n=1 Tax=Popillia japonica TaxID=7064 RepID=A0AAW1LT62_POPJA